MADVGPTMTDSDRVTRRSVLKATGAAAAAGVVGAAPAAASFTEGQCVVMAERITNAWTEACPTSGPTPPPTVGQTGTVTATCWDGTTIWVQVDWTAFPSGVWVPHTALDYC